MSIMLTAIRVDRLEGYSETLLIAHDTESGIMVGRNLEIESGKESEWRDLPMLPMVPTGSEDVNTPAYVLATVEDYAAWEDAARERSKAKAAALRSLSESDDGNSLRFICCGGAKDVGHRKHCELLTREIENVQRDLHSDISEDRH